MTDDFCLVYSEFKKESMDKIEYRLTRMNKQLDAANRAIARIEQTLASIYEQLYSLQTVRNSSTDECQDSRGDNPVFDLLNR